MTRGKGVRLALAIAAGLVLGILVGRAVALAIRSDNAPLIMVLGALAGIVSGLIASCAILWRRRIKNSEGSQQ